MTTRLSSRLCIIVMAASAWMAATPERPRATTVAPQSRTIADYWLAPAGAAAAPLARAVADFEAGEYAKAAPVFAKSVGDPVIGSYALLYLGRAQLQQKQLEAATATVKQLLDKALAIDPEKDPSTRLTTLVVQRRAKALRDHADTLFSK